MARRGLSVRAAVITAALVLVAGACSSGGGTHAAQNTGGAPATNSTGGTSAATNAAAGNIDLNGVVNVGDNLGSTTGIEFDPIGKNAYSSWEYMNAIYGSLLFRNPDGTYRPDLATAWTVVNPYTVDLQLRQGVTFQDGTPFNADAVRSNLLRVMAAAPTSFSFSAEAKDLQDVQVLSNYSVRLKLSQPVAGWLFSSERPFFSSPETLMPSPTAAKQGLDKHPVGAGAFTYVSYSPGVSLVLKKSPTYWNAANVKLGGVHFVYVAPGSGQVLALRSGAIDIENLSDNLLSQVHGVPNTHVESQVTGNQFWAIYMCKSIPPLNNPLIRQAISYAIDRTAINNVIFQGHAEPITGLLPPGHPYHDAALDGYYNPNPARAKQLLAQAGTPNVSFTMMYSTLSPPGDDLGQVIKSELAQVGVTVKLVPIQNSVTQFFGVPGAANAVLTPGNDYGITDLTPGGIGNACQYNDPVLNALVAKIKAAQPQSAQQNELIGQYQKYVLDQGLIVWLVWDAEVFAWNPNRVSGVDYILGNFPGPRQIDFEHLVLKK